MQNKYFFTNYLKCRVENFLKSKLQLKNNNLPTDRPMVHTQGRVTPNRHTFMTGLRTTHIQHFL